MPKRLHRFYGSGHLHFITTSCYHRRPLLGNSRRRDRFLEILEQVRQRYGFAVVGYVVMPEHVHLLISEPDRGTPSTVMQVLKQRFARRVLGEWRRRQTPRQTRLWEEPLEVGHVWQRRFYDFVVRSENKRVEKLRYMHRNPVVRGLVLQPEQWRWSSYRWYAYGERGPVLVNQPQRAEMKTRPRQSFVGAGPEAETKKQERHRLARKRVPDHPPFENRKGWGSLSWSGGEKKQRMGGPARPHEGGRQWVQELSSLLER
jgi:putative transposase